MVATVDAVVTAAVATAAAVGGATAPFTGACGGCWWVATTSPNLNWNPPKLNPPMRRTVALARRVAGPSAAAKLVNFEDAGLFFYLNNSWLVSSPFPRL